VAHHDDLEGDTTLLIPAVDALVEKIDEKKRIIYMNLPEGLVEREEE
jgi:ribosomal 30S subunit maturation factor RimM